MSVRRCANGLERNKPDFCEQQKIIFQAVDEPILTGRGRPYRPIRASKGAMNRTGLRSRRLSPGTGVAGIGPQEIVTRLPLRTVKIEKPTHVKSIEERQVAG